MELDERPPSSLHSTGGFCSTVRAVSRLLLRKDGGEPLLDSAQDVPHSPGVQRSLGHFFEYCVPALTL
jgi:hypothetical protein